MTSWQRLMFFLGVAVVEATPVALLLLFSVIANPWALVLGVALVGALTDWVVQRWFRVERQRPVLLGVGLLLALWVIKVHVGAGMGVWSGWWEALGALFLIGGRYAGDAYLLLLVGLYMFWRGTRIADHDSISLRGLFSRAIVAMMLLLGLGFLLSRAATEALIAPATGIVLAFFSVGLFAIALASASEEHDTELRRLGWRGMVTVSVAIGLVVLLGLAFTSVFGHEAAQTLFALARGALMVVLLICLPVVIVLELLLEQVARVINLQGFLQQLEQNQLFQQQQQQQATEVLSFLPPWVAGAIQVFFALIPVLLIVALFLLVRRRAWRAGAREEERESLWSWQGLGADLRDLFAGLRRPVVRGVGLREALARLRGEDPVNRIRRSYIRLLLFGEGCAVPRRPAQTPFEYESDADMLVPAAQQSIEVLTRVYERARYYAVSATPIDAAAAERAWDEIEVCDRRSQVRR